VSKRAGPPGGSPGVFASGDHEGGPTGPPECHKIDVHNGRQNGVRRRNAVLGVPRSGSIGEGYPVGSFGAVPKGRFPHVGSTRTDP
jgi:hypothetical protein